MGFYNAIATMANTQSYLGDIVTKKLHEMMGFCTPIAAMSLLTLIALPGDIAGKGTVGQHDFLLTPCSAEMFRIIYGDTEPHRGCFGNLCEALCEHGIAPDNIPTCFNIFMNVPVDGVTGKISVLPPKSKAGDYVTLHAKMDLIVGMTACSAGMSNNFSLNRLGI